MNLQPIYSDEEFPCNAMYHDDPETGRFLMFERELNQTEMRQVREHVGPLSYWVDESVLCIIQNPETD